MRVTHILGWLAWSLHASATILQNGQEREDPWPGQAPVITLDDSWKTYEADAPEVAFKGRWDSQHVSCTLTSSRSSPILCNTF